MIENILKNKIPIDKDNINFVFSGRVAINILAKKLKKSAIALIPNYICNVVDMAFEKENYQIKRYKLNDDFEPLCEELLYFLKNFDIDILLVASIYGSGLFYKEINDEFSELYKIIKEKKVNVIIDFAQDFYQINNLVLKNKNYHHIFSFNDKSFMGAMGAIIISRLDIQHNIDFKEMSFKQKNILIKKYFLKLINCKALWLLTSYQFLRGIKKSNKNALYDFSECRTFPYTFDNFKISNIQLLFALLGIFRLNKYIINKQSFMKKNKYKNNELINTAAYIVVKDNNVLCRKVKHPYAKYNDKKSSLYPDLLVVHNKGFCDI